MHDLSLLPMCVKLMRIKINGGLLGMGVSSVSKFTFTLNSAAR